MKTKVARRPRATPPRSTSRVEPGQVWKGSDGRFVRIQRIEGATAFFTVRLSEIGRFSAMIESMKVGALRRPRFELWRDAG